MTITNLMCIVLGIVLHRLYIIVQKYKKVKEEYDKYVTTRRK